ncbi:phosphatase [Aminiphilus sp.]|uniref:Ppx/GppA phosphatase family protein n=1 Tax=Aminiphilus sp. TaxID=1872488 RepID=UPI002607D78C|nr:phosphatase [Aminiphilus sp.]
MSDMERFAAVDVGSNSVRSLVVAVRHERMVRVDSSAQITRLAEGLRGEKAIVSPEVLERTLREVRARKRRLDVLDVPRSRRFFFATEGLRAATNAAEIRERLEDSLGVPLRILSGTEEGRYSFLGARTAFPDASPVFDLGGGSLEIADSRDVLSLPLGVVRLTNQFGEDHSRMKAHVWSALDSLDSTFGCSMISCPVGIGGTSSTLCMVLRKIPVTAYTPEMLHGHRVSLGDVVALREHYANMSREKQRGMIGMDPRRAPVFAAGLLVLETLLERWRQPAYVHSEGDLLWGILAEASRAAGYAAREAVFQVGQGSGA